jgi:hypothetical protein
MDIYYKENTGLKTAQEYNTDYFAIKRIGADLENNKAFAEIYFWEKSKDAGVKVPNLSRMIEWEIVKETSIDAGVQTLFTAKTLETTNKETITLQAPVKQ